MPRLLLLLTLVACGCNAPSTVTDCVTCLDDGGTWQPEASACTDSCDIADISCFTDECPGACAPDACEDCFSTADCEAASCTWTQVDEAATCQ